MIQFYIAGTKWSWKIQLVLIEVEFLNKSINSEGWYTPFSVIIPAIREAGVTSNAGFQQEIPVKIGSQYCIKVFYKFTTNIKI